jgi:hypothetical protein
MRLPQDPFCLAAARPLPPAPLSPPGLKLARCQLAPAAAPAEEEGGTGKTLYLGFLFGLWYLFNIQFNM